jgi:hypothetical protein
MARWFDHEMIGVEDVDRARAAYQRLGFFVTPRMRHSHGTSNALVMFRGNFLELIGDFENATGPTARLGALPRCAISTAFLSRDARRDYETLRERGLNMSVPRDFTRPVPMPDGRTGMIDCCVTRAERPDSPAMTAFVSNQRAPEFLWVPEWQEHPNGAKRVEAVSFFAERPLDHVDYFRDFIDPVLVAGDDAAVVLIDVSGVRLEILAASACERRFGAAWRRQTSLDAHAIGVSVRTRSLTVARDVLDRAGCRPAATSERSLTVGADDAEGLAIEFLGP